MSDIDASAHKYASASTERAESFREQVESLGYPVAARTPNGPRWFFSGDIVYDREDDDPAPSVVVAVRGPISEWAIAEDATLADANPEYDDDEATIIVVYAQNLKRTVPEYTGGYDIQLSRLDGKSYAFPLSRLARTGWAIYDGTETPPDTPDPEAADE